jgi:hypothetical protein
MRLKMPFKSKGFANTRQLSRHFIAHAADFKATKASDYERRADAFLAGDRANSVRECKRTGGDTIRFEVNTQEFGVLGADGFIRTYFKPVPCSILSPSIRRIMKLAGRCHRFSSNLKYFSAECRKW